MYTIPGNVFPNKTYTRSNFSRTWAWIKRHRCIYRMALTNVSDSDVFCPYLGAYGITIPSGGSVVARFRTRLPYNKAVAAFNVMRQHLAGDTPVLQLTEEMQEETPPESEETPPESEETTSEPSGEEAAA